MTISSFGLRLNYYLCQSDGFLGTDFLAAKTADTGGGGYLGNAINNGQS
jgi:hypothetical protein